MPTTKACRSTPSSTSRCCKRVSSAGSFLTVLAARHHFRMGQNFHGLAMHAGIAGDVMGERRKRGRDVGIDEGHETVAAPRLAPQQGVPEHRVVVREQVFA